ncbi:Aste57867_1797 [Aphanomyces stellatus]|uniref:Aste57867_1797 protein n=1 Tax=Aphanomyces stellatus TaxID=120398 RepID=A0A485K733_9STRA|nr:hypothetical protein As57867_001795 [Aphanomyces stellatus]VFT79006.1 Aste57867_1797 [Aphanomyces stellatus]
MATSSPTKCCFHGCPRPPLFNSTKCLAHRHRATCTVDDCGNQVYARGCCVRHGGKKQCAVGGCNANARAGLFCCKHNIRGVKKRYCATPGCPHVARAKGLCVSHGGGRKCVNPLCVSYARHGGLCRRHHASSSALPLFPTAVIPTAIPSSCQASFDLTVDETTAFDMDVLAAVFGKADSDIIDVSMDESDGLDERLCDVWLDAILHHTL